MIGGLAPASAGFGRGAAVLGSPPAPSQRQALAWVAACVALFAVASTVVAVLDPGPGALDVQVRGALGILASVLLVTAGLLRLVRERVASDRVAGATGVALLLLGAVALPLTSATTAWAGPQSLAGAVTGLFTGLLVLGLVVHAMNGPDPDRWRSTTLFLAATGTTLLVVGALVVVETAAPALLSLGVVEPRVVSGTLLAVAWFCVGLEATLRSPQLPWAGGAAPLLGGMAVAELCAALGAASPGHGYRVASAALVSLLAALTLRLVLVDLGRPSRPGAGALTVRTTAPEDDCITAADPPAVIAGRRCGDGERTLLRPRPVPRPASPLEDLMLGREGVAVDLSLERLLRAVASQLPDLAVTFGGCDVQVHASPGELGTALRNLLDNVRQHGGGTAEVTARAIGRRVEVLVSDTGPGLPPGLVATLFQRGARGVTSSGAGLGLHVAQRLARRQDGDLVLRRSLGGCAFALILWGPGGPTRVSSVPDQRATAGTTPPSARAETRTGRR